jgi:hypothetical protein
MNDFVNPNKRSIQLPNGAKDLVDVLQAKHRKSGGEALRGVKCEYCGAFAVSVSYCCAITGFMEEEVLGCCEQCQQDLWEFAARPENQFSDDINLGDAAAMEQFVAEYERREREFMRQRVSDRKPDDAT